MIIKIVTISLMAVFYICYFAKLISQKNQGIKTDQLGKGKEGFVKFIEVALKIITYLLPVIQIISIVFYSETAHIVLQFTGVVITMFGVLAFIVSVTQMKENWRAGVQKEEKTNLVTTGIYSISRNPAFLGFDLMYIGILFSDVYKRQVEKFSGGGGYADPPDSGDKDTGTENAERYIE